MDYDFDLIAIGSGTSGRKSAVGMHNFGWKTAVVELDPDRFFAGTCVTMGCVPTKALLEKARKTGDYSAAVAHKEKIVERIRAGTLRNVEEKLQIPVLRGFANFIDPHTLQIGDQQYTANIIVIATGSEAAIPPIKGLADVHYMTSMEMLDLQTPPKKLLIIGGGRIGLEFADLYNAVGVDVTVFEGMQQVIPGDDTEIATMIKALLIEKGVKIYTGRFVDEVREVQKDNTAEFSVVLSDGENAGTYTGDMLLVATGRIPRTAQLQLENAGVATERRAVKVNEFGQTNIPHIFAVGDVVGNPMFTNWAGFQATNLVNNLRQSTTDTAQWQPLKYPAVPRACFTEPEYAAVGLTEEQARDKYGDKVVVYKFRTKWLAKFMVVDNWNGVLKGIGLKGSNEIIGVHLLCERSASLVQMFVFAMDNGLGWQELASMVYPHPVLVEGVEALARNMVTFVHH